MPYEQTLTIPNLAARNIKTVMCHESEILSPVQYTINRKSKILIRPQNSKSSYARPDSEVSLASIDPKHPLIKP